MNVAIIGLGALGKRHLEAVLNSQIKFDVYCVDPNEEMLNDISEENCNNHRVVKATNMGILPRKIDFAVISTSSSVRRSVFEELVEKSNVRNILFEKVLFQRKEDFEAVLYAVRQKNIRAWVNCARREHDAWKKVKREVSNWEYFEINITGNKWGIGCNGIHMLDLVSYLSDETDNLEIEKVSYIDDIIDSKRQGYKEYFGQILGHSGKCQLFTISCYDRDEASLVIEITGKKEKVIINESQRMKMTINYENGDVEKEEFVMPFVTHTTKVIMESILSSGDCNLISFEESCLLHLKMMEPLFDYFEKKGISKGLCPIT